MSKSSKFLIVGGVFGLAIVGILLYTKDEDTNPVDGQKAVDEKIENNYKKIESTDPNTEYTTGPADDDSEVDRSTGEYLEYSEELLASSDTEMIVLFFHAKWCPSCREQDENLSNMLDDLPANLTIFKVDYDEEVELKQKYGVTLQHTFVQIDGKGESVKKWNTLYQGNDLDAILDELVI